MLVFATSDKGGTGRSVTSCNLIYRRALQGTDVCYADFDFGSPTAGAIFEIPSVATGAQRGGLHSYLQGRLAEPVRLDVWSESDRESLRTRPIRAGALTLFPGDKGGGEFPANPGVVRRCTELFLRLEEEFEISLIDLSAGRSQAIDLALEVTAQPALRSTVARWMVFHRWTRQHIVAAAGLVYGDRGIVQTGHARGHDMDELRDAIRFVRTAVPDRISPDSGRRRRRGCRNATTICGSWLPNTHWAGARCWARRRSIRYCNGASRSSPTGTCWPGTSPIPTPSPPSRTWRSG